MTYDYNSGIMRMKLKEMGGIYVKKIAVPTKNGNVASHFGHCSEFTIYDTDNGNMKNKEVVVNPGHEPGFLPKFLSDKDVEIVLAGGIGTRAIKIFNNEGIDVITGVRGKADDCLGKYLSGDLDAGDNVCDH